MEKLLKQAYQIHRKEVKDLLTQIETLKNQLHSKELATCLNCKKLEKALHQKTEDYDILLSNTRLEKESKKFNNKAVQFPESDNLISTPMNYTKNLSKTNIKSTSIFIDSSIALESPEHNASTSHFTPIPETPLAFMDDPKQSFNFSNAKSNCQLVSETFDESLLFDNETNAKNVKPAESFSLTPPNLTTNFIRSHSSPEVIFDGEVSTAIEENTDATVDLNVSISDFEIPHKIKRRREDAQNVQIKKAAKLKKTAIRTVGWKPFVPSSSSAQYSFVPAENGYRKPKYKQTTLSQTLQAYGKTENNKKNEDLDLTYVPTQCLPPEATKNTPKKKLKITPKRYVGILHFDFDDTDSEGSEELLPRAIPKPAAVPINNSKPNNNFREENAPSKKLTDYFDDYDKVPRKSPPINYKYVREAVRKKDDRMKLNGQNCHDCEKYYNALGLSESEKKERMNNCSKHRDQFAKPKTPEHFWSPDFPITQETKT